LTSETSPKARGTDSEDLARTIGVNVVMGLIIVALKLALPGH
jgi:hypothetical protein